MTSRSSSGAGPGGGPLVAAIDCGTNTIKLMVADLRGDAAAVIEREVRMVRLGQDVDRTGRLADEALERAFAAIDEYAAIIARHPVGRIRFCATSAARDADNGGVFAAGVRQRLGVDPEVLPGLEEAGLAFDGAVRNLRHAPASPVLVIDIGGGSTELVLGSSDEGRGGMDAVCSMDVGSVRMHERHLHSDPPTPDEVAAATADIDAALDASGVETGTARTVVGVAGTVLTVAAAVLDLDRYDRARIDQAELSRTDVHTATERLLAMSVAERRALPYMHPGRADVIGAGALVLDRVLRRTSAATVVASEADILDGIALSLA